MAGQPIARAPAYMIVRTADGKPVLNPDGSPVIDYNAKPGRPTIVGSPKNVTPAPRPTPAPSVASRAYVSNDDPVVASYSARDRRLEDSGERRFDQGIRSALQGVALGWSDEMLEPSRPGYRERYAEGAREFPLTNFIGEVGGSFVAPGAKAAWKFLPTTGAFGNPVVRGGVVGALHGGPAAAGDYAPREVPLDERAVNFGLGAVAGGVMGALAVPGYDSVRPRILRAANPNAMDEALSRDAATYRSAMRPKPDKLQRIPRGMPLAADTGGNEAKSLIGRATSTRAGARVANDANTEIMAKSTNRMVGGLRQIDPDGKPQLKNEMVDAMAKAFFDMDKGIHKDWKMRVQGGMTKKGEEYLPISGADRARIAEKVADEIDAAIAKNPENARKILQTMKARMANERYRLLVGGASGAGGLKTVENRERMVEAANQRFGYEPREVPLTAKSAKRLAREAITPRNYFYVAPSDSTAPLTKRTLRFGAQASDYDPFGRSLDLDEFGRPLTLQNPVYWAADLSSMPAGHFVPAGTDALRGLMESRGGKER
jgi:hypothetical protein